MNYLMWYLAAKPALVYSIDGETNFEDISKVLLNQQKIRNIPFYKS